jgi:two-component system NtrC family sensor kinase
MAASTVLIVDDDPLVCQALAEALELGGYATQTATRGAEVLQRIGEQSFDAAVVDIVLPDLPGLELLRAIKGRSPDTEVVLMSGYASLATALQAIDGTAFAYLVKPFPLDQLLATVGKALERQQLSRALRESEARYRLITEHIHDAILLLDHQGCVALATGRAETLLGVPRAALPGRPLGALLGEEGGRLLAARLTAPAGGPAGEPFEFDFRRPDGVRRFLEVSLPAVTAADEGIARLAVLRDLTERKRAEEELEQQREALFRSEKLAAMGSLLAGVAHELNNPLSVVMGQSVLIRELAGDGSMAARADKIVQAAERCARIVRDFLALARRYPRERRQVDLNEVVRATLGSVALALRADAVEVTLALAPDLPRVAADRAQLQQTVANLVSNAHQALRGVGGPRQLILATRTDGLGTHVLLEVADSGPGIPVSLRGRIFEPFFTTRPTGQGTGLGLSLCQAIVESHGGRILYEERSEGGALFRLELPVGSREGGAMLTEPPAPVVVADSPSSGTVVAGSGAPLMPSPRLHPCRILLVEDETLVAQVLAELFAIDGHEVDIARDGGIALDRLAAGSYDIIVSDVRMPGLDGPGLYREVERRWPEWCDRFVFLTGDTLSPEAARLLEASGAITLAKPVAFAEVRAVVQRVLQRQIPGRYGG